MDPDGRDSERLDASRWRDQESGDERTSWSPPVNRPPLTTERDREIRYDREPDVSGRRDWEEQREDDSRGERSRERLPLDPERSSSAGPRAERPVDEQAYQPSRRPLAAEPRPVRGGLDADPIDVEPEVLDDPW